MKSPYTADLQPGQVQTAVFLVQAKDVRQKKTGEPYLSVTLADRSGEIDAKMWDNVAEVMDTFDRDDFVRVKGMVQIFQNRPQLTIHKLVRLDDREVDFKDFFPASERDPDEMLAELRGVVSSIGNPHLRALLEALFADPEIASRYRIAPAAKLVHHAYLGGLIEHVLSMCHLARLTAVHYRNVDLDLLLTGVVLHDIGKIHELSYERSFSYSDDGQLLGHMVIGLRMVADKLRDLPEFPPKLRTLVEHMIISHHGELEFGSPKVPVFPEALLLHHLDNLDSKMECMRAMADNDRHVEGCWTNYNHALERIVLKKARYLAGDAAPAQKAQPAGAAAPPPAEDHPAPRPGGEVRRPVPQPQPRTPSLFGEKLGEALRKDS